MAEFRIETPRLVLRDWRGEDWPPFFAGTNTPAVMRWLGGVMDQAAEGGARERLEGYAREHGHTFWVVERKADGAILGFCGLKKCNQAGGPLGDFEIGWRLREDAWGQGYAREAAETAMAAGFEHFGAPHIVALTVEGNAASWGLMRRLGMERRADLDFANGDFDPVSGRIIVYSITRAQWDARSGRGG
ncbi:MAG: GNAT family N-acetyltransferase [Novosphingobium sp. SCN 66-18]|nr:MAG: GNAT family N-acetyltransferase [Novosphingobium sp. SCN 66-18]